MKVSVSDGTDGDGYIISRRDNPVILGTVPLASCVDYGGSNCADEASLFEPNDKSYGTLGYELQAVSSQDPYTVSGTNQTFALQPFPSTSGFVTGPVSSQWELHGLRLFTSPTPSQVFFFKEDNDYNQQLISLASIRLHPDTIIVPIQVYRMTSTENSKYNVNTASLSLAGAARYFDDVRLLESKLTVSDVNGQRKHYFSFDDEYSYSKLVDEIFVQCNVQFRMIRYVEVPSTNEAVLPTDDAPPSSCECGDDFGIAPHQAFQNLQKIEEMPGDLPHIPRLIAMGAVIPETCCDETKEGFSKDDNAWVNASSSSSKHLVWAHELAHVLGITYHADEGNSGTNGCSEAGAGTENSNLMCMYNSLVGTKLTETQCHTIRSHAQTYASWGEYYGLAL